jgi:N-acetylneuraminic acid mutarotase
MITLSANKVLKGVIAILIIFVQSACATATEVPPTETSVANTSTPTATLPPTDTPTPEATSTPTPISLTYPPHRGYHSMVYDSESNAVILYGGQPNDMSVHDDTWSYETSSNTWTQMGSLAPELGTLAFDSDSDRVLNYIFIKRPETGWTPLGKMLAYDFNTDTWMPTNAGKTPSGYIGAQMAYDSESDRVIFFGGYKLKSGSFLNETFSYNFNTNSWKKMEPKTIPPGRNYHVMVYHPTIDRVIMFGGDLSPSPGNDTWEYDFNTDTWEMIDVLDAPPDHYYSSMVYVSSLDRIILFGGMSVSMRGATNDMWMFDHTNNTWTELTPEIVPSERAWHAMAYDAAADKIVLFGGGPDKLAFTDETWVYDPQANMWTDMTQEQ